ncbi:MAG: bifunctional hydroxymethylpyrimidine kinase/phosphomethylpyrimidine kinase [Hyphomicrobiaceae bacterium]
MARILAISSEVARGHVGLSAIVPALHALGHDVVALPTILLSNHPGHPHVAGERVSPDLLIRMLDALETNGWLSEITEVLTGYLPTPEHVAFAANAVARIKATNPHASFTCDAVLGDEPKGLYIAEAAAAAIRDMLVPQADVVKMNRFEAQWLTGKSIASPADATTIARQAAWSEAVMTSLPVPEGNDLANVRIVSGATAEASHVAARSAVPKGTGDLLAGLLVGYRALGTMPPEQAFKIAVASVDRVVAKSLGRDELQLIASLPELSP